ncbi:hypothetical protein C9374_010626 [Naegleria lovaniensis]|uniref:BTB domain-containing protein n=1 Tax=Naegleria lovaniensis TaxID=51637 RepID=A0AA88GFF0_NAELO|nr:uncharacterized protein C9374_010626 [Naegleria lovaniensis]KAG2374607.1 hypothetical protein C9374_010626 [Naegleria lovaniensis]
MALSLQSSSSEASKSQMMAIHAQLYCPYSVFVSSNDEVYIADTWNHRIRKIMKNGMITTIAGNGTGGYNGDNQLATNAQLNYPDSVFVSSNDEVNILDSGNHRIRKIMKNGMITTIAGTGIEGYNGDNQLATNAQLNYPDSVFVSSNDEVYIADTLNHRIRKIMKNGMITTIAGNGTGGYNGDNQLATNAQLNYPDSVFVSSNDEVYIADTANHRIRKIMKNGMITTIAGNGTEGYNGDNQLATNAQLNYPDSVFVSSNDEVYIADTANHRIRKIMKNGMITTIAGNGTEGYNGDNQLATNAQLSFPESVFVSSNDEVYIADTDNHRIRKIMKNGMITTIAGNGTEGYNGDNQLATNAQLNYPDSVFVSSNDEVYIADTANHRIRKIMKNGMITTIAGNGIEGYNGDSPYQPSLSHFSPFISHISKYERDMIPNTKLIVFQPLFEKLYPHFHSTILKDLNLLSDMSCRELELIQNVIDFVLYDPDTIVEPIMISEIIEYLYILGLAHGEFMELKNYLISILLERHMTSDHVIDTLLMIEQYLTKQPSHSIMTKLKNYCLEFIQIKLRERHFGIIRDPRCIPYYVEILEKCSITKISPIVLEESTENTISPNEMIKSLWNDKRTSDIRIKLSHKNDHSFIYGHRTILSSRGKLFEAMFNSGYELEDLKYDEKDEILTLIPSTPEDAMNLEYIVKYCYDQLEQIEPKHAISLILTASANEMSELVSLAFKSIQIDCNNYFEIANSLDFENDLFSEVIQIMIDFGVNHRNELFKEHSDLDQLPASLSDKLLREFENL